MLFARSVLFWLGFTASTITLALLGLCTAPFPFAVRYRVINSWTCFNLWWLKKTCRVTYQVEGWENLPQSSAIVFSKHQSTWETLALPCLLPVQAQVLKRELLWVPFFGWGLALLDPIAIDRKAGRHALKQLVDQGKDRLERGRWVVVFPEGTRVPVGEKGRYHKGGAILAAKTGFPVVPVAHDAGRFWPRGSFVKRPGNVRVMIGPAIQTEGRSAEEILSAAERWIETTVADILSDA
jgi:1-acyl-sn-glycerol-3-phosphate acyltransferase